MKKLNFYYLGLILMGAMARLVPHPPNFTPTGALGFFAGNKIANRWLALGVPLGILALSDIVIGWHATLPFVYVSFLMSVVLGQKLGSSARGKALGLLASSVIFFIVSNFGVWLTSGMYLKTLSGLGVCYAAALPFFRNELAATFIYGLAFFTLADWLEKHTAVPALAQSRS